MKMTRKGISAVLAVGLVAAMATVTSDGGAPAPATAQTGGHFVSEAALNTKFVGEQEPGLGKIEFTAPGIGSVECEEAHFTGSAAVTTLTEVELTPVYANCWAWDAATEEVIGEATINVNGCTYAFSVRGAEVDKKDSTFHLRCPFGKKVEIIVPTMLGTCTMTIAPQTPGGGVVYTTAGPSGNGHRIVVQVTVQNITYTRHKGACAFLPTTATNAEVHGTVDVAGYNISGGQVGITVTGS